MRSKSWFSARAQTIFGGLTHGNSVSGEYLSRTAMRTLSSNSTLKIPKCCTHRQMLTPYFRKCPTMNIYILLLNFQGKKVHFYPDSTVSCTNTLKAAATERLRLVQVLGKNGYSLRCQRQAPTSVIFPSSSAHIRLLVRICPAIENISLVETKKTSVCLNYYGNGLINHISLAR